MVASATVQAPGDNRPPLVCNCAMSRVSPATGEVVRVRAYAWDCPSCGLDKRRSIAEMCSVAGVRRMVTLTLEQYRVVDDVVPARHSSCDPFSHQSRANTDGTLRWKVMSTCPHCCAWVSRALAALRKRLRRRWGPEVQYLWGREEHKSGAIHLHVAVLGLPDVLTRKSRAGRWLKKQWREVGGGFVDIGHQGDAGGARVGWYIGKYLAKRQDKRMAAGYRRWSRTRSFAPGVRMYGYRPPTDAPPGPGTDLLGWHHPVLELVNAHRVWLEAPRSVP